MLNNKERILVVDDDSTLQSRLIELLVLNGYVVDQASNGIEAIQKSTTFSPDLVILDIVMPKMDGLKFLRQFRENRYTEDTPVIMLSSKQESKDIKTGFELGANDYVTKPFDNEVLLAHIRRHLDIKRRIDQLRDDKDDLYVTNELITTLHAKKKTQDILYCLVQKIAEHIQVKRCSVIRINEGSPTGIVEASSDGQGIRGLEIDLNKYPEVIEALNGKNFVIIPNVNTDKRMSPVRDILHEVGCFSLVVVPIVHGDELIGTLLLNTARSKETFSKRETRFLKGIAKATRTALLNAQAFEEIDEKGQETVASLDPLTKLYSYYKFLEEAEKEIYRSKRYGSHLSLILVDIEQLRKINEIHGKEKGDLALKELGLMISENIRKSDLAARCQGGDFAILLPETSHIGATVKAKRFQKSVLKSPTLHRLGVTVQVGVSSMEETQVESAIDLIHSAEVVLERAKTGPFAL
jgi:diguanylate cyclase (GGDEF)-like protein